jgi:hypothetical protein
MFNNGLGNTNFLTGQMTITSAAVVIPVTPPVPQTTVVYQGAPAFQCVLHLTPTVDCYIGASGVTTATGLLLKANVTWKIFVRAPVYVIGTSGTLSFLSEYN